MRKVFIILLLFYFSVNGSLFAQGCLSGYKYRVPINIDNTNGQLSGGSNTLTDIGGTDSTLPVVGTPMNYTFGLQQLKNNESLKTDNK